MIEQVLTRYALGGATDPGRRRSRNEDSFRLGGDGPEQWLIVADGMGGYQAGEVASRIVTDEVGDALSRPVTAQGDSGPRARLWEAVNRANHIVFHQAGENEAMRGMGTTAVVALGIGDEWTIANVGDSRAYLWTAASGIRQITTDHSLVQDMVRTGQLTPEAAAVHPHRHIVTQAVGTEELVQISVYTVSLQDNDKLLLCSDGLTEHVADEEIGRMLARRMTPDRCVAALIRLANKRGGRDNITVAIAARQGEVPV